MDTATITVIGMFAVMGILIGALRFFRTPYYKSLSILFFSLAALWFVFTVLGEFIYSWSNNALCSPYLGCNAGFFGHDAFEHLFFGIAAALGLIWFSLRFPTYSLLNERRWKTILTVVAIVALVSVVWEIGECAHDALRVDIFHEPLRNFRLHIDLLDQPSNLDTMGDLSFALLGSILSFLIPLGRKS